MNIRFIPGVSTNEMITMKLTAALYDPDCRVIFNPKARHLLSHIVTLSIQGAIIRKPGEVAKKIEH